MPVILSEESAYCTWLKSDDPGRLKELLQPYRGQMLAYRVSSMVNSPKYDHIDLILK